MNPYNTDAVQGLSAIVATILFSDIETGVTKDLFVQLPNGLIPVNAYAVIETPFNPGTSLLVDIGYAARGNAASPIAADTDAYHNDLDLEAVAGTRVAFTALPAVVDDASGGIQLTWTPTLVGAAPTAGEMHVILTFAREGRSNFPLS